MELTQEAFTHMLWVNHGDTEFVPWSQALLSTKLVDDVLQDNPNTFKKRDIERIEAEVRNSAYKIIDAKGANILWNWYGNCADL